MSIKSRLDRLEKSAGAPPDPAWCNCAPVGSGIAVDWGDDPEAADPICPTCGKPIRVVVVTWDDDGLDPEDDDEPESWAGSCRPLCARGKGRSAQP